MVQPIALGEGITEWSQNVLGVVEHFLACAVPGGLPWLLRESRGDGHGRLLLLSSWRLRTCSRLV